MMKKILSLSLIATAFLITSASCGKKEYAHFDIVPKVNNLEQIKGSDFVINGNVKIVYTYEDGKKNADFLSEYVKKATGISLKVSDNSRETKNVIKLSVDDNRVKNKEGYILTVNANEIDIVGGSDAGVFYGIQTLRKSLPVSKVSSIAVPSVKINDEPRFSYRGAHLDVARHFYSVDDIKTYIDMMVLHNMNVFHWHLTEDQGWRIEIDRYPLLIEKGSTRKETVIGKNSGKYDGKPYGGYYTKEEAKEIVRYAKERNVTVVPEIDLPGHMLAALTAYPHLGCTGGPYEVWTMWGVSDDVLCAGNPETYKFIEGVLDEIMEIFPSEYIHIGGDECPKVRWKECPKCQAKIKQLGIKGDDKHTKEEYLQSHVIGHAEKYLNSKGRRIIGWDEILEGGLAPDATVMSWRGEAGGIAAAKQKHDVIMTPNTYCYFDYYQTKNTKNEPLAIGGYLPVEKVYSYEPMSKQLTVEEQKYIKGVQANLWTEYVPTFSHAQYMVLPRWAALSEVQWTKPENKNYEEFLQRLLPLIEIYKSEGYNYAKHIFEVKDDVEVNTEKGNIEITLNALNGNNIYYTFNEELNNENKLQYKGKVTIDKSTAFAYSMIDGNNIVSVNRLNFDINKATAKPIKLNQPISKGYTFKGEKTLVDGLCGDENYKTGRWLGFQGNDLDVTIDLLSETEISNVSINAYVVKGDWIFGVSEFSVEVSNDGTNFRSVYTNSYPTLNQDNADGIYNYIAKFDKAKAKYLRVVAKSEKQMPEWHPGKGKPAFIFVDEIKVN